MNASTMMKQGGIMNRKTVSISSKRQITIPQKFFTMLGFETEAECIVQGDELILRPARVVQSGGEFSEQILAELIREGKSGEELLSEFKARQAKIRPAVERTLEEAEKIASGKAEYSTYEDVFGGED